jgi:hypothetical protein
MAHVSISRDEKGKLAVYFNGIEETQAKADSLPALQPIAMKFKYAGFGKRSDTNYVAAVDEFFYFNRALTAEEVRKFAGK